MTETDRVRIRAAAERAIAACRQPSIIGQTAPLAFPSNPSWRGKTEVEKAIAFEAIRTRIPDAWTLLEIVESANPPDEHDDPSYPGSPAWHDIEFAARDGWQVTIFYDGGELDYITEMRSPDGLVIDPWEWPDGAPGGNLLRNWRGVGLLARMRALAKERAIGTIDCTALGSRGQIDVTEAMRDSILNGGTEILSGYLDWDASRILRIPTEAAVAA